MGETFIPRALQPQRRAFEREKVPPAEMIPETLQHGTAVIRCYLCGSVIRRSRSNLMAKGARCKCGALTIPARPDPCRANGEKLNKWYQQRRKK